VQQVNVRLVGRQGGVFTLDQARTWCSDAEIRSRLRRGTWRRSRWRGVLVDGELPDDIGTVIRAAALWLGGDLVACRSTAAALWGFDIRGADRMCADDLHFLAPDDVDNRRLRGLWVHPSSLGTDDAVLVDGIWCTPAARTACDVVRTDRPIDGLATLDLALRSGACTGAGLGAAADAQTGLREVVRLRELLRHADARAESPMESRMRWRFIEGGLPPPQLQVEVRAPGRRHRLDTGWEEWRLGAEFDGLTAHLTREQLAADRDRHNWLTERGWRLLHFTGVDVYRRSIEMVDTVRRHLQHQRRTIMGSRPPPRR